MTPTKVLLAVFVYSIVRIFFIVFGTYIALADDNGHSNYHAEFYQHLMQPNNGTSCCNDHDCRPVKFKITNAGPAYYIGGRWIIPPKHTVMEKVTPDGKGHWCGVDIYGANPLTYCANLPFGGV